MRRSTSRRRWRLRRKSGRNTLSRGCKHWGHPSYRLRSCRRRRARFRRADTGRWRHWEAVRAVRRRCSTTYRTFPPSGRASVQKAARLRAAHRWLRTVPVHPAVRNASSLDASGHGGAGSPGRSSRSGGNRAVTGRVAAAPRRDEPKRDWCHRASSHVRHRYLFRGLERMIFAWYSRFGLPGPATERRPGGASATGAHRQRHR